MAKMTQHESGSRDPYQRFWEQLDEIRSRHPGASLVVEPETAAPGSGVAPRYVYEESQVLCTADPDWVGDRLSARIGTRTRIRDGLYKLELLDGQRAPVEADRLNQRLATEDPGRAGRPVISPNHLIGIAPVTACPADEPKPVPRDTSPWPPARGGGGAGVQVLVVDSGLFPGFEDYDWLAGVEGGRRNPYRTAGRGRLDDPQWIKQYAGHGTFVAGVVRCAAPEATIEVSNELQEGGALLEDKLGTVLLARLDEYEAEQGRWPHIISLSAGGNSHGNCDLLGLQPFLDQLADHPQTVLVAAAGNDGSDDLFFPAASAATYPGAVISVGALRRDQKGRACFSNHGETVTVFAPGEHHVNAFPPGLYYYRHPSEPVCRYYDPPLVEPCTCLGQPDYGDVVRFSRMARWSGTSFATPLVAGMIASHMTETGELGNARAAAADLFARRMTTLTEKVDQQVLPALAPWWT
jgi:hypothetical protein